METPSKREFIRVPIQVRAEVKGGGLSVTSTATQNLSLKGMFISSATTIPEGTACAITLFLGDGDIQIEAEGPVVHCYEGGFALQFSRIMGLESFEHLRKLLLYNAADPDAVEGEFNDAIGIHRTPVPD